MENQSEKIYIIYEPYYDCDNEAKIFIYGVFNNLEDVKKRLKEIEKEIIRDYTEPDEPPVEIEYLKNNKGFIFYYGYDSKFSGRDYGVVKMREFTLNKPIKKEIIIHT